MKVFSAVGFFWDFSLLPWIDSLPKTFFMVLDLFYLLIWGMNVQCWRSLRYFSRLRAFSFSMTEPFKLR